jgi:hypothetical protein
VQSMPVRLGYAPIVQQDVHLIRGNPEPVDVNTSMYGVHLRMRVCMRVCMHVRACMRVYEYACVRVHKCASTRVRHCERLSTTAALMLQVHTCCAARGLQPCFRFGHFSSEGGWKKAWALPHPPYLPLRRIPKHVSFNL